MKALSNAQPKSPLRAFKTFSSSTHEKKAHQAFTQQRTENQYRFSSLLSFLRITSTYPVEVDSTRLRLAPPARCNGNLKLFLSLNAIKSKRHSHAEREIYCFRLTIRRASGARDPDC